MNALLPLFADARGDHHAANVLAAARALQPQLNRSRTVERRLVSNTMTIAFGGSDAAGAWSWRDAFMSRRKRILVFSDAGGTGRSYHADLGCANRDRRRHYLCEPGWRADAAIQGLGRSHRTNQASAPLFSPVTTDIHGEKRFTSTISRRLDSLGALTKGERRAGGQGLFRAEDNLESPWARRALQAFYVALHLGDVPAMDRETFEAKTGLPLLDGEGQLKGSEQLLPMNTFLNRLLALRIEDQNALFETFDAILQGVVERAAGAGLLDRGLEDIVADDLAVTGEDVVRRDAATGAETKVISFEIRTARPLTTSAAALTGLDRNAVAFAINAKSQRAGLVVRGLTTTDDEGRLVEAVRLIRPEKRSLMPAKAYQESAWEPVDEGAWRLAWDVEVAGADPFVTRPLILATGLLLPVWKSLPSKRTLVRRLKAPDGRRWLGRVLEPADVAQLRIALGLSDTAAVVGDGDQASRLVLEENLAISLAGGFWLRRARVMDRWRIEVVGAGAQRAAFQALGCVVEIISYTPRVFAPVGEPAVLSAILARWPAQSLLPAAA